MKIIVTRTDPMAGIPDSHEPGLLSRETFADWRAAFDAIITYGVKLTPAHEAEIMSHPDTQFQNKEFINFGHSACTVNVHYDVRVMENDHAK